MAAKNEYLYDPDPAARSPLFRNDYRPTEYKIPKADVSMQLDETRTIVRSLLTITRNPALPDTGGALVLDGENLKLKSLRISEGGALRDLDPSEYLVSNKNLVLKNPPAKPFELEIVTEVNPSENTQLSGVYTAGDILCSQCEAQGFRRISYFLDRPDNLTTFTVSLTADKTKYPVLLSNGNGDYKASKDNGDGTHSVTWTDPWPKPSYLFAIVGGDLKVLEDEFITMSGKKVDLRIFVQPGYEDKIKWAMQSIKRSMKWDEDVYGREYDLDCFHIVAVDKFNAGAMENKGLNIFNVAYLVGDPATSTDAELTYIEAVIGHEYFHNYSGDRVTVRDWFELTLKEGLTVLRDHQFTADTHSKNIQLIDAALVLRATQFLEDSGPMSHPIRPERVEEFDNIYTGTIYEKGAHVLGMLRTMMGGTTWRTAMDEYFTRFDGQAVTCEDFIRVMEEISGIDLKQFRLWYSQSGTPEISYSGEYDAAAKTYKLTLSQETKPTADQAHKEALHMPIAVGLIGESGNDVPLSLKTDDASVAPQETRILHLTQKTQTFEFTNVPGPVVPSVLRGFSAPVKVVTRPTNQELIFRMAHDSDSFNKYEATERLMLQTIQTLVSDVRCNHPLKLSREFLDAYGENIAKAMDGDMDFNARTLQVPPYNLVTQDMTTIDPESVNTALNFLRKEIGQVFQTELRKIYDQTAAPAGETYDVVPGQVGRRTLHNTTLSFLGRLATLDSTDLAYKQYQDASNMTEKLSALNTLAKIPSYVGATKSEMALEDFYNTYKNNSNLVTKWLSLSAAVPGADAVQNMRELLRHPAYDETNPNKVYALIGGFVSDNALAFHDKDGSGYKFLADVVIHMNDVNPKTATNIAKKLTAFKRYDAERQELMVAEMKRIMAVPTLDVGIKEILGKALETATPKKPSPKNLFGDAAKND